MTSKLKVNLINDAGDNNLITSDGSGSVTLGTAFPAVGKIGQVVQGSHSTAVTLNTSSFVDTGLTASITPSATSSKVLVSVVQSIYLDGGGSGITLKVVRDSTTVFTQPVNYARYMSAASNERIFYPIEYLDSPSSTSSLTFKTQGICQFNTGKVQHDSITSVITLMEVLA
jgi:hypothetical protein